MARANPGYVPLPVLGAWAVCHAHAPRPPCAGAALIMAMVRLDYFWIANVIYLGFVLWAVVGAAVKLVAYRRGLSR